MCPSADPARGTKRGLLSYSALMPVALTIGHRVLDLDPLKGGKSFRGQLLGWEEVLPDIDQSFADFGIRRAPAVTALFRLAMTGPVVPLGIKSACQFDW